jgi:hypothetical protein
MRTITISKDHRKQKRAKIQRETIITPILADKYKREKGKR